MNIYYLGPVGSYSYSLVQHVFPKQKLIPFESFDEIVTSIQSSEDGIGVLAIENSISSSVHKTVDLMYDKSVCIVGEASMMIHMNLLGKKDAQIQNITDIYSHPQALAQCADIIRKKKWKQHETQSTSQAATIIENKYEAVIGSEMLAAEHNLTILQKDIANVNNNMTRWVFIARPGTQSLGKINKLTYIFKVKHESGSLVKVLTKIAEHKGNLTKIESRPLPGTHWEYGFWIDVEVPEGTHESFDTMMQENTLECRLVGAYKRGMLYNN